MRRCCCKRRGCLIVGDDFNREPSTNLGIRWAERAGDWSILSSRLREAGNVDAVVQCLVPHPLASTSMIVNAETYDEQIGDQYGVIVNYKDENNYHEVIFTVAAGENSTLQLCKVSGGVRHILETDTLGLLVGTTRSINVCFADQIFRATITDAANYDVWLSDPIHIEDGIYSGLSNPGGSEIQFKSFYFLEHWQTNPVCPKCRCWCGGNLIQKKLLATYYGTGQLDCANGESILLEWDKVTDNWLGSGTVGGVPFDLMFGCGATDNPADNTLQSGPACPTTVSLQGSGTCEPLNLTFGPIEIPASELACWLCDRLNDPQDASFYWIVTEAPA